MTFSEIDNSMQFFYQQHNTARLHNRLAAIFLCCLIPVLNGCSLIISNATQELGNNLQQAMLNSDDPDTVATAIPAYLLLQEALLANDSSNKNTLLATSQLYSAYASLLPDTAKNRKKRLSNKAFSLALRAVCLQNDALCALNTLTFAEFEQQISTLDTDDYDALYTLGKAWAGWIQTHTTDWNAIAQLAQVKKIIRLMLAHNPNINHGEPLLYFAVLESILPPALGGNPEVAKQYFERALELSQGRNLIIHVMYAKQYARMMFDRELHDKLLKTVIDSAIQHPGLTLTNSLAQQKANELLHTADDYF